MASATFHRLLRLVSIPKPHMRTIAILFFLLAVIEAAAQNLVVNPGFEEHGKTTAFTNINGFKKMKVKGWYQPTRGTSDYFLTGPKRNDERRFIKINCGAIEPYKGKCFTGFYSSLSGWSGEYVGGTLSVPLEKGKKYVVSCALALGSVCKIGVSEIGMYFSEEKVHKFRTGRLKLQPQVTFDSTATEAISGNWKIVTAEYTASGGETYFIIGNFTGKSQTIPGVHLRLYAYYALDEVSVVEQRSAPIAPPVVKLESSSMTQASPKTDSIAPGKTLVADYILFETGKADLLAQSYPPLYAILAELKKQPGLQIEIDGHTDDVGDPAANQTLSEERVRAVADFFISNGIAPSRITTKGFGSTRPVGTDRSKNRRVEFIFSG